MIDIRGLTKRYGDRTAVSGLTLQVAPGEIFGLLGPNGAGKTTTIRMLAGMIHPTEGTGTVAGLPLGRENHELRHRIGLLTEVPGLYERLSAGRNLDFFGQLHGLPRAERARRSEKYLRAVGLWERKDDPAGSFSKGMKQRLAIARTLLHEPPVLFLDEPTSGLDPEAARAVREVIAGLKQAGRTIILSTHNLDEADRLCDRIGVLKGQLLSVDTPENLRRLVFGRRVAIRLAEPVSGAAALLGALPGVRHVTVEGPVLTVEVEDPEQHNPALTAALVHAGARVQFIEELSHSLEDVYLTLLGKGEQR